MVGHLLARDRQSEGGPRLVRADPAASSRSRCDLLLRVLAPQEQHVLMGAGELGRGKLNQAVGQGRLLVHGRSQGGAGRLAQRGVRDRLDAVSVMAAEAKQSPATRKSIS